LPVIPLTIGMNYGIFLAMEKVEKKKLAILRILEDSDQRMSSSKILERLHSAGHEMSERTVRFYLLQMDREGLTDNFSRQGRRITDLGHKELSKGGAYEKVGLIAAKIDEKTYGMTFDLKSKSGTVVMNVSFISRGDLIRSIPLIQKVFSVGFAMGTLMTIYPSGKKLGEVRIPEDCVGIGTVCSVTLNGVLLSYGIPTTSRFGGLLEMRNWKPLRFVELIHYEGTTLDPLEIFIKSGMTNYTGATSTGNGLIGAGFRELPAGSRGPVAEVAKDLEKVGLGGFMAIGWPGQPLFDIPVSEGRFGAVVIGGLNPVAILEEQGIRTRSRALATFDDYGSLFRYDELSDRAGNIL